MYSAGEEEAEKKLLATQKTAESFICHTVSDNRTRMRVQPKAHKH